MLFEHFLLKSHVGTERRLVEFNRLRTQIEEEPECPPYCWVHRVATTAEVKKLLSGSMRPPAPAHALPSRTAVKLCSQFFSTVTSSSIKARISPCASRIPALRACDFPGLGSNKYRKRPGCRHDVAFDDLACADRSSYCPPLKLPKLWSSAFLRPRHSEARSPSSGNDCRCTELP